MLAVRPRGWKTAVVAHATRNAAADRPADAPVALRGDDVLRRHAKSRGGIEEIFERSRVLHAGQRGTDATVAQRHPRQRALVPVAVAIDDRAPDRLSYADLHARCAFDADRLLHRLD